MSIKTVKKKYTGDKTATVKLDKVQHKRAKFIKKKYGINLEKQIYDSLEASQRLFLKDEDLN